MNWMIFSNQVAPGATVTTFVDEAADNDFPVLDLVEHHVWKPTEPKSSSVESGHFMKHWKLSEICGLRKECEQELLPQTRTSALIPG